MMVSEKKHGEILDLIPAYVLQALDAAEIEKVTNHLATCPACRAELIAYEALAEDMALAAPLTPPPATLKSRLLDQIHTASAAETADSPAPLSWQQQIFHFIQQALAPQRWQLAAILLIVALLISNLFLWQRANRQESLPSDQVILLVGEEIAPQAQGRILISEKNGRNGTLIVEGLPPLSPEQQYQLWLIQDGRRVSGGVFSINDDGYSSLPITAPQPLQTYPAFGVTIEPAGGSPGPTGDRVLGFNL